MMILLNALGLMFLLSCVFAAGWVAATAAGKRDDWYKVLWENLKNGARNEKPKK